MNCLDVRECLPAYVDGLVSASASSRLEAHLAECPSCRAELSGLERLVDRLTRDGQVTFGASLETGVMDRIFREQAFAIRDAARSRAARTRMAKIAAAAILMAGLCAGVVYWGTGRAGAPALADALSAMRQIKTVTWTEIQGTSPQENENDLQEHLEVVCRCAYKAPGRVRRETTQWLADPLTQRVEEYRHVHIIDHDARKALLLIPSEKTAALYHTGATQVYDLLFDVLLNPKRNVPPDVEPLGESRIDGQPVVGFRIRQKGDGNDFWGGDTTDIWVSVKTKRVALVEGRDWGEVIFRLKDFVFDRQLDDSLFSLEPPQGYTLLENAPPVISAEPPRRPE